MTNPDSTDILAQAGGIQAVAQQLGITEAQAASGAAALLPAIMGGFKNQAQANPAGAAGLGGLLNQLGGGAPPDAVTGSQPAAADSGNNILGQIFGSKDVSRTVAQDAAAKSGLSPELLKRMLPLLAMLVTAYLAKQHGAGGAGQGGLGGVLGGILGGAAGGNARSGMGSMLDLDGDGNALNDLLRMAGKALR
ncbi:DUF937 domain-containing protein [Longimicrobium terrae]|uniref:DUF937 domain-containing protein n=1 Tax=Longimicrobium terrae TaxID=1639882 RepID=A0A841GUI0_9BACT|nr:DUF937 domain-containing protein [Longimicrobium terrae]MBB4634072.1 hypothetical protein [Longimicrobium terrae]MBB6069038.1 hypothetical protein [Longimicrobium terrae]NNC28214.1 DUF937 domain-containing protein [Longimicrobium terrae]